MGCSGIGCAVYDECWARREAKRRRFKCSGCYAFTPHLHLERLEQLFSRKKPSGIAINLMGDMFDSYYTVEQIQHFLITLELHKQHRFYIKTKQAWRLPSFYFPQNVWLGVTVNMAHDIWRIKKLSETNAKIKFVCFEPLYEYMEPDLKGIDWIILGAQTRPELQPKRIWVDEILGIAMLQRISVFIKNNLKTDNRRQEFPKENGS